MKKALMFLTAVGVASCATARTTMPEFPVSLPAYQFEALKAQPLDIEVMDQRSDRQGGNAAAMLREGVARTFDRAGVAVSSDAEVVLELRLVQLRSDFSTGNWRGCTELIATVRGLGREASRIPISRCVTRSNMFGYRSADEALQASFDDAVSALMAALDAM